MFLSINAADFHPQCLLEISPCRAAFLASFLAPPLSLMEGNLRAIPNMLSNCDPEDDATDPFLDKRLEAELLLFMHGCQMVIARF